MKDISKNCLMCGGKMAPEPGRFQLVHEDDNTRIPDGPVALVRLYRCSNSDCRFVAAFQYGDNLVESRTKNNN